MEDGETPIHDGGESDEPRQAGPTATGDEPAPSHAVRDAAAALFVVVVVVGAVAGQRLVDAMKPSPTREQCERLLAHHLDRSSRQHHPDADDRAVADALVAASAHPSRDDDLRRCQRDLTAAQVACGLAAPNVDALERCLQ